MYRQLIYVLVFAALLGCGKDKQAVDPGGREHNVDKTAFLASLVGGHKYWRFEELIVEHPSSIRKFNLRVDSTGILPVTATQVVTRHTACRFQIDGRLSPDQVDAGPYGNIPYTPQSQLGIFVPGYSYPGSWFWDESRQTVAVKDLNGTQLMISAISKTNASPEVGYLDNTMPAKYKTLNQALEGNSPDRIRIIFYEEDPEIGTIKYVFIMRAAWVTKVIALSTRTELYEVLY